MLKRFALVLAFFVVAMGAARAIHLVAEKAPLGRVYNAGPEKPTAIRRVVDGIPVPV